LVFPVFAAAVPVVRQTLFKAKQPVVIDIPLAKDEEAVAEEVMAPVPEIEIPLEEERPPACTPPAKVEVPVPRSLVVVAEPVPREISCKVADLPSKVVARMPPAKVEVAVVVAMRAPMVKVGDDFQ
jgi:hypothetical protein